MPKKHPQKGDAPKQQNKNQAGDSNEIDPRFSRVYKDPKFMVAPNKEKKVAIDSRFKGMFQDKRFNVITKVDKYGRKVNKKDEYPL